MCHAVKQIKVFVSHHLNVIVSKCEPKIVPTLWEHQSFQLEQNSLTFYYPTITIKVVIKMRKASALENMLYSE